MAMDKQAQGACWLWLVIIPGLFVLATGLVWLGIMVRMWFWYHA
jgi:hypothetical protein